MFERRLKILLAIIACVAFVLVVRAAQVQVVERDAWKELAALSMRQSQPVETFRGVILDRRGRTLAEDRPCVNAVVDFRVIGREVDEKWLLETAVKRLKERPNSGYVGNKPAVQKQMREAEIVAVRKDLDAMWAALAHVSGKPIEEIDATRAEIVKRVVMRKRAVWYFNYNQAVKEHAERRKAEPPPAWQRWLIGETDDAPQLDQFEMKVAEETDSHVVLRNLSKEAQVELGRYIDRLPGLSLRGGSYRYYPYGPAGCHLLGRLAKVSKEDLRNDPSVGVDELRQYLPNDLIGNGGVEQLAEPLLRGSRGRIERVDGREVGNTPYVKGKDVKLTIDIELQHQVQQMFTEVDYRDNRGNVLKTLPMHGAAVVIDVASGGVLAMASYPDFDPNAFDENYAELSRPDNLEQPLINRATMSQLEPGSTVKPMVGMAAIASGLITTEETIECTGYLIINGKPQGTGRCWVASKFHDQVCGDGASCPLKKRGCPSVAHHPVPGAMPHPSGNLVYADALERGTNIYFETAAYRLGIENLSSYYAKFGLGRKTGIGIFENDGRLPNEDKRPARAFDVWNAGIGQGPVAATPLQMANAIATFARDGVGLRPKLLDAPGFVVPQIEALGPARVDLHLPPDAVRAAKEGMVRVANSRAGTGTWVHRDDVLVAGKTGTAQAAPLSVIMYDPQRRPILDKDGRPMREVIEPSTLEHPNPRAPWYLVAGPENKERNHAWYVGFAPAHNPKVAFAVMIEYGISGGNTAGGVAKDLLEACIEHGYLQKDTTPLPGTVEQQVNAGGELMHVVARVEHCHGR